MHNAGTISRIRLRQTDRQIDRHHASKKAREGSIYAYNQSYAAAVVVGPDACNGVQTNKQVKRR